MPAIYLAGATLIAVLCACSSATAATEGGVHWRPASADTIVLVLDAGTTHSASLVDMRRELLATPADSELAARFAGIALSRYAGNGDPRLLGYAAGALAPWQNVAEPPRNIWLLRGRLLQTQHHFDVAATDLDAYLQNWPRDIEALILSADAWRRAGQIPAARSRCLALQLAGRADLARLCAADIFLSTGDAERALQAAESAIALAGDEDSAVLASWSQSVRGDAALAAGQLDMALEAYRAAMQRTTAVPLALQLSYTDALLAAGELERAHRQLALLPAADAVLLRRAITGKRRQSADLEQLQAQLEERFRAADELAANELHWRERALYALDVLGDPDTAVQFAKRNWAVQKGWEDAALLLRAAAAAGNDDAADAVRQWRARQAGGIA